MRNRVVTAGAAIMVAFSAVSISEPARAQSQPRAERVMFRPGESSVTLTRTIRGYETIDLVVGAREGQRLVASMTSDNGAAYFNLIAPGETDVAFYAGSMSQPLNRFDGPVAKSGDMKVRLYLYRAAARRGERATIRLSLSITGGTSNVTQLPGDALVPGSNFHATGTVGCVPYGSATLQCDFGVIRIGSGSAAVTVRKPDGTTRTIVYRQGSPIGYDQDIKRPLMMNWTRRGDETTVQIGRESYVIPDAAVFGG